MGMVTFVADFVIKQKVVTFSALNAVKKNLMSRTERTDASWMFKKKTPLTTSQQGFLSKRIKVPSSKV